MQNKFNYLDTEGIGERLREIRGKESQENFSHKFNLFQTDISRLERGEVTNPSIELLLKICINNDPKIPLMWLLIGEGEKYEGGSDDRKVSKEQDDQYPDNTDSKLNKLSIQLQRIYEEGDFRKIASIQSILDLADPGEKGADKK